LTSYAQCEFLLADLSVKVDNKFRYPLDKRISAAKAMAATDGPLRAYADDLVPFLESMNIWTERRHWFAHGFLIFTRDKKGRHVFEFRRYEQQGEDLVLLQWFPTIDAIRDAADGINRFCQAFVALHERIYTELKIEEG
jgi:hypothetical protein